MSKPKERFSPFAKQCFVTCAVCCNIVGQGCAVGFPGVLLPQLQHSSFPVSEDAGSWIASVMAVSIFFGNLASPPLMGRLGRRAAAHAVGATGLLAWLVIACASNVASLIVGRVIQGLSYGIIMPLRPVMIAEYTSPRHRGSFLACISVSQTVGIAFVHFAGSLLSWQHTALACCAFPLLGVLLTARAPESPGWLALRGDFERCRDAFRWLRGDGEQDELDKMIQTRITVNREQKEAEKTSKLDSIRIVATKKEVYKPVILATHVYLLAQFSGAITLPSYAPDVLGALAVAGAEAGAEAGAGAGAGRAALNFWIVELDVLRLVANVLAVFVVARLPRRTIMFSSGLLCVFSHVAIAVYAYFKLQGHGSSWIPILLLNLQMASIGFGMVPMANVLTGEIFPLEYRSILGTVSVITVAVTVFVILKTFPGLLLAIGLHGTYAVYCGILVYGLGVTWFLLPETKGKTLQEIEEHFRGRELPAAETEPLRLLKVLGETNDTL